MNCNGVFRRRVKVYKLNYMKLTNILLAAFGSATLALTFSACSQTATVNDSAASNANNKNTAVVANSNPSKPSGGGASDSKPTSTTAAVCDVTAYITDKDPNGLNVRDSSSVEGKIIGRIPLAEDGTQVHIISASLDGSWVIIDKATTYETVFDKKGWVSANLLAIATRGYDTKGVKLYDGGSGKKGPVLTTIPPDTELKILNCDGKRVHVKHKDIYGWLEPEDQCGSAVTRCN